jgi:hypothetical protein
MNYEMSDILKAVGPSASIIFAAWIFMGFLQQRYDAAITRYRQAISDFRTNEHGSDRHDNIREQILIYKRRCELMNYACQTGLTAAGLFLITLLAGEGAVIFGDLAVFTITGSAAVFLGMLLVIAAAVLVFWESSYTPLQLDAELLDVPGLAGKTGQRAGKVREREPVHVSNVKA